METFLILNGREIRASVDEQEHLMQVVRRLVNDSVNFCEEVDRFALNDLFCVTRHYNLKP